MRRRPFRPRPPRPRGPGRPRPLRPGVIPPVVRRALANAQRLRDAGRHLEAASIYDRLALEAYERSRLRAGIHMDLEAGRSYLQGEQVQRAQERARRALRHALRIHRPALVLPLIAAIVRHLEEAGQVEEAQQFREEMDSTIEGRAGTPYPAGEVEATAVETRRPKLPTNCPSCQAPLRPDEVEWVGSDRCSCPFCGSIVVAQ